MKTGVIDALQNMRRQNRKQVTELWYNMNKHKLLLGPKTRNWIERKLNYDKSR